MYISFGKEQPERIVDRTYSTISVCSSSNSISSIIGSVTAYITEYFKSKFPDSFFKDTYISSTMAASAIKKDYGDVKKRPYLFVQPQFDLSPGIMNELPLLFTDTSWVFLKNLRKNYNLVFEDNDTGVRVFNGFKRTKISYRLGIKVNSEIQGWNTISYIDQNFQTNGWFYLNNVYLNNQVPQFIIENMVKRLGLDLNEPLDREQFQQYLLKYSFNGIEEVKDMSTGNNRYVYKYPVNILINYPDMSNQNKTMRNNVIQNSQIEFTITAELWTPSMFILELDSMERFKNLPPINPKKYEEDGKYRFSLIMNQDYIPYSKYGRNLLMKRNFIPEVNVEYDEIDLKPVMPINVFKACNILKEFKIPMSKLFTVDLYINGNKLFDEMYSVDEKDFILKTKNPMKNTTYTVTIYADMEILNKINILMEENKELTKELKEYLLTLK